MYQHTLHPTNNVSKKQPEIRENFYNTLESVISKESKGTILIIAGDFNAKTGQGHEEYPKVIGSHGKGEVNENGNYLIDVCARNELVLTNTLFQHKMAHRTTWVCPERKHNHTDKCGTTRRNPYRNRIDYIIMRQQHRKLAQDSRSYSGTETTTDHRLVKTRLKLEWHKIKKNKSENAIINLDNLKVKEIKSCYKKKVTEHMESHHKTNKKDTQAQWDIIKTSCIEAAKQTLGKKENCKKSDNPEIKRLSEKQIKLKKDKEACKSKSQRQKIQKKRNEILNEIHKKLKQEEEKNIEEIIKDIENNKNDSTKMYKAIRIIQKSESKKKILVQGENGLVTNSKEQVEIISKFFEQMFYKDEEEDREKIPPKEMNTPFTPKEIELAVRAMKNNKSPGVNNIQTELIKHGPTEINDRIAELLNNIAKTGNFPTEIKEGILIPLPKLGKKQGPPENLRPIILLSVIRKILAICMIKRIAHKLNTSIPITQAAYREGRSTTELSKL